MNTVGEGRYRVFIKKIDLGNDKIYVIGGGERSHIGGVVICQPDKKPQTIYLEHHYDYHVLEPIAIEACKKYNTTCMAVGGIHIGEAKKKEIEIIVKNCKKLIKYI